MLAEIFSKFNGLYMTFVEAQISTAKTVFNSFNMFTLGGLSPYSETFDQCCNLYMDNCKMVDKSLMGFWPSFKLVDTTAIMKQATENADHVTTKNGGPTRSGYENLRDVATNQSRHSILDDDRLWEPSHGTNAKSAHRYDAQRERIRYPEVH
jgi:hypothetical protein